MIIVRLLYDYCIAVW